MSSLKELVTALLPKLKFNGDAFINGKYVKALSGKVFSTENPATRAKLADIAECDKEDVDLAVKVAKDAFESGVWSRLHPSERKKVLFRFASITLITKRC